MTQRRAVLLILILVAVLVIGLPGSPRNAQAQGDGNTPIYFMMDGDIWLYTPATGILEQGSAWGFNEKPVMSPNGAQFAYASLATIGADFERNGGFLSDPRPTNIWIWGGSVEEAYRLVDQPANASIDNQGGAQNVIRRSSLGWSPDGSQLAWIELGTNFRFQLVVQDFDQNNIRFVPAQLPIPYGDAGFIGIQGLAWGPGGIAVENLAPSANQAQGAPVFESTLTIFDPVTGNSLSHHVVGGDDKALTHFYWADAQTIALFFRDGSIGALNIPTDTVKPTNATELFSLTASGNSGLTVQVGGTAGPNSQGSNWTIMPSGFTFETSSGLTDRVALSPSGNQVAWVDDALYVWSNNQITRVAGTESVSDEFFGGITWGATGWRVVGTSGADGSNCSNVPAPRLVLGANGAVIPGLGANVLRDRPGRSAVGSVEIGEIPVNGVFIVMAGPQCASGLNWWQVNYNGQVGWTAEGEGNTYWLEPR